MKSRIPIPKNLWLGSALALLSAAAFALNLVFAGISYQYGANIHALNLSRALLFLVSLQIVIEATKAPVRMPPRAMLSSALVGVLLCAEMYVLLGAIQTIPVALAVLVFYTYPMLIAAVRWITGREPFQTQSLLFMLIGFAGWQDKDTFIGHITDPEPVMVGKDGLLHIASRLQAAE